MSDAINDRLEVAWAAGFYDGEGSVSCTSNNGNQYARVQLSVGQKNEADGTPAETLVRFMAAVKKGKIYKKTSAVKELDMRQFGVHKRRDVESVLLLLWPFLSTTKKLQTENAFRLLDIGIKKHNLKPRRRNGSF